MSRAANAVQVSVTDLLPGTNYQLQVSGDLAHWTNEGPWVTASNTTMVIPQAYDVASLKELFFRMQPLTSSSAVAQVCINNLMVLNKAIRDFQVEADRDTTDFATLMDCTPFLKYSLVCPAGGTSINDSYVVSDFKTKPNCISLGGGAANGHVLSTNVPIP